MLFANAMFISIMFLGGYLSPFGGYLSHMFFGDSTLANALVYLEQVFWLFLKSCFIIFLIIWVRATLPIFRFIKVFMGIFTSFVNS